VTCIQRCRPVQLWRVKMGQCSMVSWAMLYTQLTWSAGVNKVGNKTEQTGHSKPTPDSGSNLTLTNAVPLHKWLICPASLCVLYLEVHCLQYLKATDTRWFKYDWDWLHTVYTQISPGHIWTTLYHNPSRCSVINTLWYISERNIHRNLEVPF
jgi:hypothetical protein